MTTAYSTNLGLALPVEGELSGTWGDTVNNGITQYSDISIAGTLTLNGDGAVTLTKTNGSAAGTNIGSTTAQYAVLKITGTTTTKVITAPSSSKTYTVINASGYGVTIKASGHTGVTVAAGKQAYVAFDGTDYVLVAGSAADGVTSVDVSGGTTGLTTSGGPVTSAGTITLDGTLAPTHGGTGLASVGTDGQVLTVVSGAPAWANAVTGLPDQTGHAGEYLTTDGTNPSWSSTGAAAGGAIYVNNTVISTNYTIATGQNGFSVGPITVSDGYAVTVSDGQRWVVI